MSETSMTHSDSVTDPRIRAAVEQLLALDARLGAGKGAARERARLTKIIDRYNQTHVRK